MQRVNKASFDEYEAIPFFLKQRGGTRPVLHRLSVLLTYMQKKEKNCGLGNFWLHSFNIELYCAILKYNKNVI